jgi:outer membrane protein
MKKMINKIACAVALGLTLLSTSAVQASDLKIAVIDMRQVLTTSAEAKAVQAKLKKEFGPREQELISRDKTFKEMIEKLQRNAAIMSAAERSKLEKDITTKQKELQTLQIKFQEDGTKRQQEEAQKLFDKIRKAINQVAVQNKFDMVLVNEAVPYFGNQKDITQPVMQVLGK